MNAISTQATWATVPPRCCKMSGNARVTTAESASTNPTVNASSGTTARRTSQSSQVVRALSDRPTGDAGGAITLNAYRGRFRTDEPSAPVVKFASRTSPKVPKN